MSRAVVLDTSVLSHACRRPGQSAESDACARWMRQLVAAAVVVYVPEVTDYELRRELIRTGRASSLARLDALQAVLEYVPITTEAMRVAADLWAQARNNGWATADPKSLDGDVILAAQALTLAPAPAYLVVATQNVAHLLCLSRPAPAPATIQSA